MGLEVEKRGLTATERELLARSRRRPSAAVVAFGLFLLIGSLLAAFAAMCDRELGLSVGVIRAVGTALFITLFASAVVWRLVGEGERAQQHPDVLEGAVTELRMTPVAAWRDDEPAFFLDSGDGRIVYLAGPYLEGPVREGRFPCSSFVLVRAPLANETLGLHCSGTPMPATDLELPEDLDDDVQFHLRDGVQFDGSGATLAKDIARWFAASKREQSLGVARPRDIEVEIALLATEEGGRTGPIFSGYPGQIFYDGEDWGAVVELVGVEAVLPGERARAFLSFVNASAQVGRLSPGQEFSMREGPRTIGRGRVLRLVDLEDSARRERG